MEIITKIFKLTPIAIATMGIISLLAILKIDKYIPLIDLTIFRQNGDTTPGVIVVASFTYISIYIIIFNLPGIKKIIRDIKIKTIRKRNIIANIKELSKEELQVLSLFIYSNNKSIPLNTTINPVRHILDKEIAHLDGVSELGKTKAYIRIRDTAWKYLNKHKSRIIPADQSDIEYIQDTVKKIKSAHNNYPLI
jgi:hypothetical protein